MIVIKLRQGIGFDIEFNEDICHLVEDGDEKQQVYILTQVPSSCCRS